MKKVELFTDGACKGNPGAGGWCAVLKYKEKERILSGGETDTTNNRMELIAVIKGLSALKESCEVSLYSDSSYVINSASKGWAKNWKAKGWKKSDNKPALNTDLWEEFLLLSEKHEIQYIWIKGHDGHSENEFCDRKAVEESEKFAKMIK